MNKRIVFAASLCAALCLSTIIPGVDAKPRSVDAKPRSKQSRRYIRSKSRPKRPKSKKTTTKTTAKQSPQMQYLAKLGPLVRDSTAQTLAVDGASQENTSYSAMMKHIGALRRTLSKMRAISPVPKSYAQADKLLVEWSLTMDKCLDIMKVYAGNKDSDIMDAYLEKRREVTALRNAFFDELERKSDPGVKSKVYVNG